MTDVHSEDLVAPHYPVSTSSVPPAVSHPVGELAHRQAVERLVASYRAIPSSSTVRLAKETSNLFRVRSEGPVVGLDVSGLRGVVSIDPVNRTADVQGMCTYEDLVAATLPHGLMPFVVPQLKTITLGGAVTGLGIESTSFRNGLPHESVLELDILVGTGEVVTARPTGEHADLFRGFPNSYGSLGYATRLRIELEPTKPAVALRHVHFPNLDQLQQALETIVATGEYNGEPIDFLDGVVFAEDDSYLTLGQWSDHRHDLSDYTGRKIFYRSVRGLGSDALTVHDYLWRWDPDWFWCSGAFLAQNPVVRALWPARYRRSDVYHRIVGLENRYGVMAKIDAWRGKPARERVIQDVEVPVNRTADFMRWFIREVRMSPVWLCPLRLRDDSPVGPLSAGEQPWSLYPLKAGTTYVNVGFWGTVPIEPGRADGDVNRKVEEAVDSFDGHKSLYSSAFYDEETFWAKYGGAAYRGLKDRYDPQGRLTDLYSKVVRSR
ncbi:FAD-binding oxidoreductase [Spongisporangium articulatum]|uniref:Delta(24)-sterol reductase n=1 Tax=Spongisporangium articulatum TaxID=3362603 RepID=A0ABW8AI79_9ACTN